MPIAVVSPPSTHPVTFPQIKRHLRLDHAEDDEYLDELTQTATLHVEAATGQSLITRTMRQYINELPDGHCIELTVWPIKFIKEVRGYDFDGTPTVLNSSSYKLDNCSCPSVLMINQDISFQAISNGLEVDMIAGYGDTAVDIPSNISRAILVLIAHWYELRGVPLEADRTSVIPDGLNALLEPLKRVRL